MRLIINIKKIVIKIDIDYYYEKRIQINYKGYIYGRMFWFYDNTFTLWFKNVWHGCGLWQSGYKPDKRSYYKNNYIYSEFNKYITLGGKLNKLKN